MLSFSSRGNDDKYFFIIGKLPYCSEGCDGADMEVCQHAALQQDMGGYKVNHKMFRMLTIFEFSHIYNEVFYLYVHMKF